MAIVMPTYMQTWGLARNFGADIHPIHLREELGWQPDLADIDAAIVPGTRLVIVTNPNNPTGAILSAEAVDRLVARADAIGAWILADEVYQGAERALPPTRSFWGRSERVIITNGLSKAYGLPGLRIGWSVASPAHIAELWSRKDYTPIGPTIASDALATLALQPAVRQRILERTRGIIRGNWAIVGDWLAVANGEFSWRAPDAGAIVLLGFVGTPAWPWFEAYLEGHSAEVDVAILFNAGFVGLATTSSLDVFAGIGLGWWLYARNAPLPVETATVSPAYPSQAHTLLNATGYVVAQRKAAVASKATGRLE